MQMYVEPTNKASECVQSNIVSEPFHVLGEVLRADREIACVAGV